MAVLNRTSRKPTGHDPCVPGTPRPRPPAYLEQRAARHVTTPRAGSVLPETRAAAPLRDSSQLHSDRSPALETTTVPNRRIVSLCHAGRGSRRRHDVTCPLTAGAPVAVAAAPTNRGGASHVAPRGPPLVPHHRPRGTRGRGRPPAAPLGRRRRRCCPRHARAAGPADTQRRWTVTTWDSRRGRGGPRPPRWRFDRRAGPARGRGPGGRPARRVAPACFGVSAFTQIRLGFRFTVSAAQGR